MATIATLVMAAPAPASTFSVSGANLVFEAAPGEVNELTVSGGALGVTINEESATLTAGPGCSLIGSISVSCPYSGSTSLIVRMGDGADEFHDGTAYLPASVRLRVEGGTGNDAINGTKNSDLLFGGAGKDIIGGHGGKDMVSGGGGNDSIGAQGILEGGAGNDFFNLSITPVLFASKVFGGAGNDRVISRNGVRDFIDCGPGRKDVVSVSDNSFGRKLDRFRRCEYPPSGGN